MTCIYDNTVFEKFKKLSVRNISDICIGEKLYGNCGEEFVARGFRTDMQEYQALGIPHETKDNHELVWIKTDGRSISARDRNIGTHYNPWLLFKSKEVRDECCENLIVTYADDDFYDFDYFYDHIDD